MTEISLNNIIADLDDHLHSAKSLREIGLSLKDLTLSLWPWDAFVFTVRLAPGSNQFRSILLIDTIDGERVECMASDFNRSEVSPSWKRLLTGQSVLTNRQPDERRENFGLFGTMQISLSVMMVPVQTGKAVSGIISVQSYEQQKFTRCDLELLRTIVDRVGPHLLRCRSDERIQEFLFHCEKLTRDNSLVSAGRTVANIASTNLGWDFLGLFVYSQETNRLKMLLGMKRSDTICEVMNPETFEIQSPKRFMAALERMRGQVLHADTLSTEDKEALCPFHTKLPLMTSTILVPVYKDKDLVLLLTLQAAHPRFYTPQGLGIVNALAHYCHNVYQRAIAEQAYRQNDNYSKLVIEHANDGMVICQSDRFIFFNEQFSEMVGYTAEELHLLTCDDIYTEDWMSEIVERHNQSSSAFQIPHRRETAFRKRDGSLLPVELTVRILRDYDGASAVFVVIRNISERIESAERIRKSERELRSLFAAITDKIVVLDSNGRYLDFGSDELAAKSDMHQRCVGRYLHDAMEKETADAFLVKIRHCLQTGETQSFEYRLRKPDTPDKWFNATISQLEHNCVLVMARNVTERKKGEEELFRSNALYKALLDGSEDYIFVLDRDLRFTHVNNTSIKRFGKDPKELIGRRVDEFYPIEAAAFYLSCFRRVFDEGRALTFDDEAEINGEMLYAETVLSPVKARSGEVEMIVGVSRDITQRRLSEQALKQSEQRYAVAVQGANDGIWDWDLATDKVYLSPRWWAIVGKESESGSEEYMPEVWLERIHYADLLILKEKIDDHIAGVTPHLQDEHRILHENNSYRWVLCRGLCVRDKDGRAIRMAGSISDITDRKEVEERLQFNATHDNLTGLPNRAYFLSYLQTLMARMQRLDPDEIHYAVLFLDLDRFKVINDSLGHQAGDDLIRIMAQRLCSAVRPGDVVARLGGDEFTILLEGLKDPQDATRITTRALEVIAQTAIVKGFPVQTTASAGIVFNKREYEIPEDLLRDADTAMYRAKSLGRNRYQVFDQDMHHNAMELLRLEGDLHQALAERQFVLHYQPIHELQRGRLTGFEVLLRWNHPEFGLLPPGKFIPLAEETGVLVSIGWWIIKQALDALVQWNALLPNGNKLNVSINLSPKQFLQQDLLSRILELVSNAQVSPDDVILEITEGILMDDSQGVFATLQEIREAGFKLDLDDFGTGFSSLSYLQRFPLDMMKIDRSFVSNLGKTDNSPALVTAMVNLARGLNLQVTGEGIETYEQYKMLKELGCDFGQGFLFGAPVDLEKSLKIAERGLTIESLLQELHEEDRSYSI